MHLTDLPEDCLRLIDNECRKPGGPATDLWFNMTVYEHRIRMHRIIQQLVLSGLYLSDLEFSRLLIKMRNVARVTVYGRTDDPGDPSFERSRTIQILGLGSTTSQLLLRGAFRNTFRVIDQNITYTVEEHRSSLIAQLMNGQVLTLVHEKRDLVLGRHAQPTMQHYTARISQRRHEGSKAQRATCKCLSKIN